MYYVVNKKKNLHKSVKFIFRIAEMNAIFKRKLQKHDGSDRNTGLFWIRQAFYREQDGIEPLTGYPKNHIIH